ncbi:MAG: 2-succinyl-5-enolpyruvyl-6-hydroxy-3-cyclohexene-1-carboxylic-acid synthase, partial [Chitinophagales bacterium]
MKTLSDKLSVHYLVELCAQKGIKNIIISPGSRNAPLNISFNEQGSFQCLSIPDERVAGFFALGIAQQTHKPVVITCTSGSAALNFAPAIVEAYYQQIPLLVLTADRPVEWIDQGNGQTMRQREVFRNYVKKSYELPQEIALDNHNAIWNNNRIICEAIDLCTQGSFGPVHINIPLREPLYGKIAVGTLPKPKVIEPIPLATQIPLANMHQLGQFWKNASKKMILCGLMPKSDQLNELLHQLALEQDVVVLTETTANLNSPLFLPCIDNVIDGLSEENKLDFTPDLLLTIGGAFISKKIKQLLRTHQPTRHWHIEPNDFYLDTFQSLTQHIPISPHLFFEQLLNYDKTPLILDQKQVSQTETTSNPNTSTFTGLKKIGKWFNNFFEPKAEKEQLETNWEDITEEPEQPQTPKLFQKKWLNQQNTLKATIIEEPKQIETPKLFQEKWLNRHKALKTKQEQYLSNCPWSDFKAFELLLPKIPKDSNLQMGNSTAVRYVQLFDQRPDLTYNSNRGVAGIDGSTSTGAGAAWVNQSPTTVVTGDVSFFYDSNAFWHHHLSPHLRVVMINNGGGNIFRIIPGPATTNQLEDFFETHHSFKAKGIAETFGLVYYTATSEQELTDCLATFYAPQTDNKAA